MVQVVLLKLAQVTDTLQNIFLEISAETFNFMYQEKAVTLPMYKFWAWLIVPYFALSLCFHTLVNLINDPRGHYMDQSEGQTS